MSQKQNFFMYYKMIKFNVEILVNSKSQKDSYTFSICFLKKLISQGSSPFIMCYGLKYFYKKPLVFIAIV